MSSTRLPHPMYAALLTPAFPLAVLLRDDPSSLTTPIALLDASPSSAPRSTPPLRSCNRAAARCGIAPGMTPTRALARCPRLQLLTPDPRREHENQDRLRDFAAGLTPDFEESGPGLFILDLLTLPHARHAPPDWIEQTLRKATALRLPLQLAFASTPDLALLAAHSPKLSSRLAFTPDPVVRVQLAEVGIQTLGALPLSHIATLTSQVELSSVEDRNIQNQQSTINNPSSIIPDLDLLTLWGLRTLGDLAALPRQGLAERLGPDAVRLHDILHAKHRRLLTLHRPPEQFRLSHALEHPLDTLEPLLFLLHRDLDTLCARLAAAQRAAQSVHLSLTFADGDLHLRELRIPDPSRDPATLLRLLHTHLDTVRAPAPVTAFHLKLLPTRPAEAQHHLFERSLRDPNKFADTLARLEAFLGPGRLGTPVPLDTHKPDAFALRSAICVRRSASGEKTHTAHRMSHVTATALPLRRFRPAIEIHVASEPRGRHFQPLALLDGPHPGPIAATHGPFPLSGHWWDPAARWQRIEWDVQLADHTLLRLAHLPPQQWLLEGSYG